MCCVSVCSKAERSAGGDGGRQGDRMHTAKATEAGSAAGASRVGRVVVGGSCEMQDLLTGRCH